MAATAEKVTPIEEGKDLVQFGKALVKFDIQEQVIRDLEEATRLEITDTASEKVVRKHRQNAKALEVKIEKHRLQLNREYKEKTDAAAALIAPRVTAVYEKLDEKVKAVEVEREARKAEKAEAERLRLGKIQWHMDGLEVDCGLGLGYNLPSIEIRAALHVIHEIEISAVDYEERTEEAEQKLSAAIAHTKNALQHRLKWEADQAEAARVKAEQEAEAKRLAEERAKMDAERKEQEEKARKAAEAEAEIRRQEEEALQAEREALEKEKARLAAEQYARDWDEAHAINLEMIHEQAIAEHEQYKADLQAEMDRARADANARWEATEKAKAEKAEREKLVAPDRMICTTIATDLENLINDYQIPPLNTKEANDLVLDLVASLKTRIYGFEQRGGQLV